MKSRSRQGATASARCVFARARSHTAAVDSHSASAASCVYPRKLLEMSRLHSLMQSRHSLKRQHSLRPRRPPVRQHMQQTPMQSAALPQAEHPPSQVHKSSPSPARADRSGNNPRLSRRPRAQTLPGPPSSGEQASGTASSGGRRPPARCRGRPGCRSAARPAAAAMAAAVQRKHRRSHGCRGCWTGERAQVWCSSTTGRTRS